MYGTGLNAAELYNKLAPPTLRLCREQFGLNSIDFTPRAGSPLSALHSDGRESTVKAVVDSCMCQIVLGRHWWEIEELQFAQAVCVGAQPITLVDIGANMGFFSRQLLAAIPSISKVLAYEPEPRNFECLLHNLEPFGAKVTAIQAALSDREDRAELYLDPTNSGNFSLSVGAMPRTYASTVVETRKVAVESAGWVADGQRIFYKSDTQGYDEFIMTLVSPETWDKVFAGVIELWNIQKPAFDRDVFASVLDRFQDKAFLANSDHRLSEQRVSTGDVVDYVNSGTEQHRDLGFWR